MVRTPAGAPVTIWRSPRAGTAPANGHGWSAGGLAPLSKATFTSMSHGFWTVNSWKLSQPVSREETATTRITTTARRMSTWKHSRQGDVMQDVPDADERPDDQDVVVIERAVHTSRSA